MENNEEKKQNYEEKKDEKQSYEEKKDEAIKEYMDEYAKYKQ